MKRSVLTLAVIAVVNLAAGAALFWGDSAVGEKVVFVTKTFTIRPTGGWYLIRAGGSTSSIAVLGGLADARNSGTVREICVRTAR